MQYKIMVKLPDQRAVRIGYTDEISKPEAIAWAQAQGINTDYLKFVPARLEDN